MNAEWLASARAVRLFATVNLDLFQLSAHNSAIAILSHANPSGATAVQVIRATREAVAVVTGVSVL